MCKFSTENAKCETLSSYIEIEHVILTFAGRYLYTHVHSTLAGQEDSHHYNHRHLNSTHIHVYTLYRWLLNCLYVGLQGVVRLTVLVRRGELVESQGSGWSSLLPQLLHGQQVQNISLVQLYGDTLNHSTYYCKDTLRRCTYVVKWIVHFPLTLWKSFSTLYSLFSAHCLVEILLWSTPSASVGNIFLFSWNLY